MKISTPARFEDITLGQIQEHGDRELTGLELVALYADQDIEQLRQAPKRAIDKAAAHIEKILKTPTQTLVERFKYEGKEYGIIPDWSKFTGGEYIDLTTYLEQGAFKNAHKIVAILYRPLKKGPGKTWTLEPYQGTEGAEHYKGVSASVFYGALAFFLTTRNDFVLTFLKSSEKKLKEILTPPTRRKRKKTNTHKSGRGGTSLTNAPGAT